MKKIYFIICFLFLVPIANANYEVVDYRIDLTILENGDVNIVEAWQMTGTYNGYERILNYKNNYFGYKGDLLTSFDKNLYNGDGIKLNEVRMINYSNKKDIAQLKEEGDLLKLVDNATKGDHSVYTIKNSDNGQIYKIYNPNRMNKDFYIDYTLKNLVINHEDVAELALYLFTKVEENISNLKVTIHIPNNHENLIIWTHGVLTDTTYVDKENIILTIDNLPKDSAFDLRLVFDNDVVTTKKITEQSMLKKIIDLEQNLDLDAIDPKDEEYNKLREEAYNSVSNVENSYNRNDYDLAYEKVSHLNENDKLKTELLIKLMNVEPKIEQREEIIKVLFTSLVTIWLFGLIIILYQIYKKYNHRIDVKRLNNDISPFKINYLLRKKITNLDLVASIIYLINKQKIFFDEKRRMLKKSNLKLTNSEEKLIKLLFNDKNKVTLEEIAYYAQENFDNFLKNYSNWFDSVNIEAENEKYYENLFFYKIISISYCIIGLFLGIFLINQPTYYSSIIIIILAIIFLIYFIFLRKRTEKGLKQYYNWLSIKTDLLKAKKIDTYYLPYVLCLGKKNLKYLNNEDKRILKTIKESIIITIKKAYEARDNAHIKYSSVKLKR